MLSPHDIFSSLADQTRLRILLLVRDMELAMGELAEVLGQSQPRVSRHVRILAEAGLVQRHKEGAWVFVAASPGPAVAALYALIDRLADGADPAADERARLADVRFERQRALDGWFEAHAAEWDMMRRMEGAGETMDEALLAAVGAPAPGCVGRLLDIGTGTGRVLERLAPYASDAVGVDRSPEMLRMARAKLAGAGVEKAEVRQSDLHALPFADHMFDTVVIQHVLHFVDDPAAAIAEAARVLAPGGGLFIIDYAPHDREELRSRLRHLRLGFEPAAVLGWMAQSGLQGSVRAEAAGPELTSMLWEGRRP